VLFFKDQVTGQVGMLMVKVLEPNTVPNVAFPTFSSAAKYPVALDEENTDLELMPPGVGSVLCSADDMTGGSGIVRYSRVGLITFDGVGRMQQLICTLTPDDGDTRFERTDLAKKHTRLYNQFQDRIGPSVLSGLATDAGGYPTGYAFLLFDATVFKGLAQPGDPDPDIRVSGVERDWLNQNSVGLVVNRYNGTLIRGND
jgi:hypothetical protein